MKVSKSVVSSFASTTMSAAIIASLMATAPSALAGSVHLTHDLNADQKARLQAQNEYLKKTAALNDVIATAESLPKIDQYIAIVKQAGIQWSQVRESIIAHAGQFGPFSNSFAIGESGEFAFIAVSRASLSSAIKSLNDSIGAIQAYSAIDVVQNSIAPARIKSLLNVANIADLRDATETKDPQTDESEALSNPMLFETSAANLRAATQIANSTQLQLTPKQRETLEANVKAEGLRIARFGEDLRGVVRGTLARAIYDQNLSKLGGNSDLAIKATFDVFATGQADAALARTQTGASLRQAQNQIASHLSAVAELARRQSIGGNSSQAAKELADIQASMNPKPVKYQAPEAIDTSGLPRITGWLTDEEMADVLAKSDDLATKREAKAKAAAEVARFNALPKADETIVIYSDAPWSDAQKAKVEMALGGLAHRSDVSSGRAAQVVMGSSKQFGYIAVNANDLGAALERLSGVDGIRPYKLTEIVKRFSDMFKQPKSGVEPRGADPAYPIDYVVNNPVKPRTPDEAEAVLYSLKEIAAMDASSSFRRNLTANQLRNYDDNVLRAGYVLTTLTNDIPTVFYKRASALVHEMNPSFDIAAVDAMTVSLLEKGGPGASMRSALANMLTFNLNIIDFGTKVTGGFTESIHKLLTSGTPSPSDYLVSSQLIDPNMYKVERAQAIKEHPAASVEESTPTAKDRLLTPPSSDRVQAPPMSPATAAPTGAMSCDAAASGEHVVVDSLTGKMRVVDQNASLEVRGPIKPTGK